MTLGVLVVTSLLLRLRFPSWRIAAAHGLAVMLVVTASANIHAAAANVPLWFRIPEQLVYFAVAVAAARSRTRGRRVKPLGLSVNDSTIFSSYPGSTSKS